jgi:hypothetical protein
MAIECGTTNFIILALMVPWSRERHLATNQPGTLISIGTVPSITFIRQGILIKKRGITPTGTDSRY